jgi:hypothetical protein
MLLLLLEMLLTNTTSMDPSEHATVMASIRAGCTADSILHITACCLHSIHLLCNNKPCDPKSSTRLITWAISSLGYFLGYCTPHKLSRLLFFFLQPWWKPEKKHYTSARRGGRRAARERGSTANKERTKELVGDCLSVDSEALRCSLLKLTVTLLGLTLMFGD